MAASERDRRQIAAVIEQYRRGFATMDVQELKAIWDREYDISSILPRNTALADSHWLVGSQVSAADITLFLLIQLILRAASKDAAKPLKVGLLPLAQSYPNIAAWVERVEAIHGYEKTYPPHWK